MAELEAASERIVELERELRDRAVLTDEIPLGDLAQGNDICEFVITFLGENKKHVKEEVQLTWDEVFRVIGPTMYGYILRKRTGYGQDNTYTFQDNLEEHIRARIIDKVQNRKIKIETSQIDACILQFKELGLLMYAETKEKDGQVFRGVTLTEEGERKLTLLTARVRKAGDHTKGPRATAKSRRR